MITNYIQNYSVMQGWMDGLYLETNTPGLLGRPDEYTLLRKHEDNLEEKSIAAANTGKS